MKQVTWIALSWLALITTSQAASFNCMKASTKIENLICGDTELSKIDEDLTKAYLQSLEQSDVKQQTINAQRQWLKEVRNICTDTVCLKTAYEVRINELTSTTFDCDNIAGLDEPQSSLINAIADSDITALKSLLKTKFDLNFVSPEGWSPLTLATSNKNNQMVEILLKNGANPNLVDCRGVKYTALELAAFNDDLVIARTLVNHGANVNRHGEGTSPLQMASFHGRVKFASFLLENGADPNIHTKGATLPPIFSALNNDQNSNKIEILDLLLQHGANPNIQNVAQQTPLYKVIDCRLTPAPEDQRLPLVSLLIKYGADPNIPSFGMMPLTCAQVRHDIKLEEILLTAGAHK